MKDRRITLLAALLVGACGSSTAGPVQQLPEPATLVRAGGDAQVGLTTVPLADSLVVRVLDADGQPVPDVQVRWEPDAQSSASPTQATTDGSGVARTLWILGEETGARSMDAVVGSLDIRFTAEATLAVAGESHEGRQGYVVYVPGDLPLIISAGHGGTLEPPEIPDRTEGTTVRDMNTELLAMVMADSIEARFGGRPHLVISHLHRKKLDPNRELGEAAQGDPLAEHTWREYHGFLDHARDRVEAEHGSGLYLDIHGHGHDIERLELGYLLTGDDLANDDATLDAAFESGSSIRALSEASPLPFSALIRGEHSLGTLYEDGGVPAVPSAQQPDPGGAPFFSGGYSTRRHGSRDGGAVSGVQIEAHRPGVRDSEAARARFAGISAAVLLEYLATHFAFQPAAAAGAAW